MDMTLSIPTAFFENDNIPLNELYLLDSTNPLCQPSVNGLNLELSWGLSDCGNNVNDDGVMVSAIIFGRKYKKVMLISLTKRRQK